MSASKIQVVQAIPLRGMDERFSPTPESARRIVDMTWDERDGWKVCGGIDRMVRDYEVEVEGVSVPTSAYTGLGDVTALKWFSQHAGAIQWVFYEASDGSLRYFNGSTVPSSGFEYLADEDGSLYNGTARARRQLSVPSAGTQFTQFGNLLYMANGLDPVVVFDGFKVSTAGFARRPGAVEGAIIDNTKGATDDAAFTSIGLGPSGGATAYLYKVTYINERGQESPASAVGSRIDWDNPSGQQHMTTLFVPLGPKGTVARRLYRTQTLIDSFDYPLVPAEAALYYFVADIPDNVTAVYADVRPDVALGSVLNEQRLGPVPQNIRVLGTFKGSLWAATDEGVHYSATNQPEVWPQGNFFPYGGDDGGAATGLYGTRDAMILTRERGIYLIRGNPVQGFSLDVFDQMIGCAAPNSLIQVPGLGLAMMSESGVYLLEGALENSGTPTRLVHLSASIPHLLRRINQAALVESSAAINRRDKEVWFSVCFDSAVKPDVVLVFHYEIGAWSYRTKLPAARLTQTADHRDLVILGSADSDRPGLYVYSHGFSDKSGAVGGSKVALDPIYETPDMDLARLFEAKSVAHVFVVGLGLGRNDITLNLRTNRGFEDVYPADLSRDQLYAEEAESNGVRTLAFYGAIVLDGSSVWYEHRKVVIRFDVTTQQEPVLHEVRLRFGFGSAGERGFITSWGMAIHASPKKPILVLNAKHGEV